MTESNEEKKRVTCKRPHPNPRFHELLGTLYQTAVKARSSLVPVLEQAINSLAKYPLPLTSGSECAILKGFDQRLCQYIDSQLNGRNKKPKVGEGKVSDNEHNGTAHKPVHLNGFAQHSTHQGDNTDVSSSNSINSDMATASKNNSKKNKNLVTNMEKCQFNSMFASANSNENGDRDMRFMPAVSSTNTTDKVKSVEQNNSNTLNDKKSSTYEKNNNILKNLACSNNPYLISAYSDFLEHESKKEALLNTLPNDCSNTPTELLGQWDLLTNNDSTKIITPPKEKRPNNCIQEPKLILGQWESVSNDDDIEDETDIPTQKLQNNHIIEPNVAYDEWECYRNDDCLIFQNYESLKFKNCKTFKDNYENDCNKKSNLSSCSQWDSLSNNECFEFQSKGEDEAARLCFQFGTATPPNTNNDANNSDSASGTRKLRNCFHNDDVVFCKQCDKITTAADAFKTYFKDKMKKDAEEIEKCVLPKKLYKPAYRSGAYAILVALLEQRNECPYRASLTKDELVLKAQKHSDESFTKPKLDSNYTAWTLAKRLISKGMIQTSICNDRGEDVYMLTAMGRAVAMELVKENTPVVTVNDIIFHGQRNDRVPSLMDVVLSPPPPLAPPDEEQSSEPVFIEMPPGTFEIIMLIDKREHYDATKVQSYCKFELRSFTVGDFLWVARSKRTGQELVLPYIVERKRMDDLGSSIKDGRFHEQKFRLRKCGLQNVIYLIESHTKGKQVGLPVTTLMQAMVNTSVQDNFMVVKTDSLEHTFKFLGMMCESLAHQYLPLFLRGCNRDTQGRELMTFEYFNKASSKNKPLTVKDTFIKMLLQLKGLSTEKALAITNKYSTPRALMKAYDKCTEKEAELLLANLKYNSFSRNVGPVVSKSIYQLFSKMQL